MDIVFSGGERHRIWPLKYWGNGKFEYDNLPSSIKKMFKESHLLLYHFAEKGEATGTNFDYENGVIAKKFKKIILKNCSDSEWSSSIFLYNTCRYYVARYCTRVTCKGNVTFFVLRTH